MLIRQFDFIPNELIIKINWSPGHKFESFKLSVLVFGDSVLQIKFPLFEGKHDISHQQDLCRVVGQCDAEEEVRVRCPQDDPQVPHDGSDCRTGHNGTCDDKTLFRELHDVLIGGNDGQVQGEITDAGIGFEEGQ